MIRECGSANRFLLIADNCGEIVLDKLFLEQVKKQFPQIQISVLVRGEEVLNDATCEDARYVGLDSIAEIISNGSSMAGTVYEMLPDDAKAAMDHADVILAKGQGNYETLSGQGRHIFYSLLCKCDLFTNRFKVPKLTGLLIEENGELVGVFAFIIGPDPTYAEIWDGDGWLNDEPYGTIHRIASNGKTKGIFETCVAYCETLIDNIRIDTHADNAPMQHLIRKNGFTRCGIIRIADGTLRTAFHKVVRKNQK